MDRLKFRGSIGAKRQTGNVGGWILMVLAFGGLLSIGSQLAPLYLDHNTMSKLLDKMGAESGMAIKSDGELRAMIKRRFKMNNIRTFNIKENVEIRRTRDGTSLVMDYEVRLPLVANVDLIAAFEKTVELRK